MQSFFEFSLPVAGVLRLVGQSESGEGIPTQLTIGLLSISLVIILVVETQTLYGLVVSMRLEMVVSLCHCLNPQIVTV